MIATAAPVGMKTYGFQAGTEGFVLYGLGSDGTPPIDYLFLRVVAGRQSGKTTAGAMRAFIYMNKYRGSLGMIIGLTADKLRDTVLPTLFKVCNLNGFEYGKDFEYNKTERALTFFNSGSVALMRSAEEPDNLPGPSLSWFWMDEFRKMPEKVFTLLQPTLTQVGYPHQAWGTSTPAGRSHWTRKIWLPKQYERDFDVKLPERLAGTYRSYTAWTEDNTFLSPEYYKTLVSTYGENTMLFRQELRGEEIELEDLVYPVWDAKKHVVPEALWPERPSRVMAGVDFGFANPTAILVEGVDSKGRHYIIDEFYRTQMSEGFLVEIAKGLQEKHNIELFVADSADPRWIRAMRAAYLPAIAAKKSVGSSADPSSGIGLCYSTMAKPDYLYVSPKCVSFRREIENYVREDSSDLRNPSERPRKRADHLMDCFRYAEIAISHYWSTGSMSNVTSAELKV